LEFGNIDFSGVRETGVPGEKPSRPGALSHLCYQQYLIYLYISIIQLVKI